MSTKKLQIIDSLIKQAENADTLDGKHADEFATASDVEQLQVLVGDASVSTQIDSAIGSLTADEIGIYVQSDEPTNVEDGDIWIDLSVDSAEHNHDDRYYTEEEIDSKLENLSTQNTFSNIAFGDKTIVADSSTDTLTLVAGDNVEIDLDTTKKQITIMASSDEYTHPESGVVAGTYKSVTVDAEGHVTDGSNPTTLDGYGITDAATKTELEDVAALIGGTPVSEQISNATATYDPDGTIASAGGIAAWITATYENAEVNSY